MSLKNGYLCNDRFTLLVRHVIDQQFVEEVERGDEREDAAMLLVDAENRLDEIGHVFAHNEEGLIVASEDGEQYTFRVGLGGCGLSSHPTAYRYH